MPISKEGAVNAKRFFAVALATVLLGLGVVAAFIALVRPVAIAGMPEEGEKALFVNERYEMAGLIRNQDYSAVVMGTSLAANYRASWFAEAAGAETLKITFPDGWISEFDTALALAYETHPQLEQVYFCLDPNILIRSDEARTVELPVYLYNTTGLDDGEFYLNAGSAVLAAKTLLARAKGEGTDLDSAYTWEENYWFSRWQAFHSYDRPEQSGTVLPADAFYAACEENLAVIKGWAEAHPDTQFTVWFPPYSILYWDKMAREGKTEAVISVVEYAVEELLAYDNVSVHCFLISYNVICDLSQYTDHIHCSGTVTRWVAEEVLAGRWHFTEENYQLRLDELRAFVANYDYETLFAENQYPN